MGSAPGRGFADGILDVHRNHTRGSCMRRTLLLLILAVSCWLAVPVDARPFDLALVLDESGSMKKNDPRQLRQGAAELFLMLCQPEQRVELMGFATETRILGEFARMGEGPTRSELLKALGDVASSGQWTDIERGLKRATEELRTFGREDASKAILVMTDGKVDLGRGKAADTASILRIRGEVTSELIQEGIRVYAVAFSKAADRELLEYLAESTGGLCVSGDRDDELQRLFLRLFEEVAEPQTVPLTDSQAIIDPSVSEATFLITIKDGQEPARLVKPDGSEITRKNWDRMEKVRWFTTPRYDLITLTDPDDGTWRVLPATTNEDDRVIVLTDLQLDLSGFDPVAKPSQVRRLIAQLESNGQVVKTPELIERLSMEARLGNGRLGRSRLADDGRHRDEMPSDGIYGGQLVSPSRPGSYDLEIIARAPTIERRIVRTLHVVDRWFEIALEQEVVQPGHTVPLKVVVPGGSPVPGKTVSFSALVTHEGSSHEVAVLPVTSELYTVAIDQTQATGDYTVSVTGSVAGMANQNLRETIGPLRFRVVKASPDALAVPLPPGAHHTPEPAHAHESHPTPEVAHATPHAPVETPHVAPTEPSAPTEKSGGGIALAIEMAILLFLILNAGLLAFWLIRKMGRDKTEEAAGSMSVLRKRAAQIREEKYDTAETPEKEPAEAAVAENVDDEPEAAAESMAAAAATIVEAPETPDETPAPAEQPEPEDETPTTQDGTAVPPDAEIIPPPEEEDELAPVSEAPGDSSATGALSNTEAGLLAEIMGETSLEEQPEETPAPAETEPQAAEPAPEPPAEPKEDAEEEPEELPEPGPALGEGLGQKQNDLLAEIMGEVDASVGELEEASPPPAEPAAPPAEEEPPAQPAAPLSQSESDLLSEILNETSESEPASPIGESGGGTPTIPDESDDKSDQDAIDDILKQIEGLVE